MIARVYGKREFERREEIVEIESCDVFCALHVPGVVVSSTDSLGLNSMPKTCANKN